MKLRLSLCLSVTRSRHADDTEQHEHRDTDSVTEATYGGDAALHRMGFQPEE